MKKLFSFLISAVLTLVCTEVYQWYSTEAVAEKEFGSPYKFYYEKLDNIEKHAYNEIITNIYDMPEEIEVPAINADQLDRIFSAILMDNPDLFFVGRKCTLSSRMLRTYCAIEYIVTKEEYLAQREEINAAVQGIVSTLTKPDDEWQTELEIHDYIVNNCRYELSEPKLVCSSVYGILINGYGACEGYSRAAKLLFDEVGIESALVSGVSKNADGSEGPHMWNAVRINGDFYYLDCTWDDPISDGGEESGSYAYFNVTTEMISKTHSEFSYNFICINTEENYFVKTGRYFEDYDRSYEKKIAGMVIKNSKNGEEVIQLGFSNKKACKSAYKDLVDNGRIHRVFSLADGTAGKGISKNSIKCSEDKDRLVLTFVLERG